MEDVDEAVFILKERSVEPILGPPKHQLQKTMQALICPEPYQWPYFSPKLQNHLPLFPNRGTVFKALTCCGPFAWQSNKLSFSPSPKTLSLHFYSATVDRSQIPATPSLLCFIVSIHSIGSQNYLLCPLHPNVSNAIQCNGQCEGGNLIIIMNNNCN